MSYPLRMARRDSRRRLTARCDITRGTYPDQDTVYFDRPCLVRPSDRAVTEVEVGGEQVALALYDVSLPLDTDVRRGDAITVTWSGDEHLVGQSVRVVEVVLDEWSVNRVAVCHQSRGDG